MEADSGKGAAEKALFDDDEDEDDSEGAGANGSAARENRALETEQHRKSREVRLAFPSALCLLRREGLSDRLPERAPRPQRAPLKFEGLNTDNGHAAQTIKTLQRIPVVISADTSISPPVVRVHAFNPFA